MLEQENKLTMMLYTDGSAGSNVPNGQPFIGMGYHGYYYVNNMPNDRKSADLPKTGYPSKKGYIGPDNEAEFAKENKEHLKVIPVGYLDGYVSTTEVKGYSIDAEVLAVRYGLDNVFEYFRSPVNGILTEINIYTDSQYAILVYERASKHLKEHPEWLENEKAMNLNMEVLYKNPTTNKYIRKTIEYLDVIQKAYPDVTITYNKVAGHSGNIGNDQADRLAVTARKHSERGKNNHEFNWSVNKYWKPNIIRHPFLRYKELFFLHNSDNKQTDSSSGYFTVMNYGSIDPGKRSGEPIYGIIHLSETPVILRELVNTYDKVTTERPLLLYAVNVDKLFKQDLQRHLVNFGVNAFTFNKYDQMLLLDEDSMVYPIYPPGLAIKVYKQTQALTELLEQAKLDLANGYENSNVKLYIDITDKIYEDNGKKKVCKLNNNASELPLEVELDKQKLKLTLYMDKDILNRNILKSMENDDVKVYTLFIRQGRLYYTYYTIIFNETLKSYGIWTNLFSSRVYLEDEKHQEPFVKPKKGKK